MTDSVYVSLDIETNGSYPIENSMLSLGAVAYDWRGEQGFFYRKIQPIPGSAPNAETMIWWQQFPDEWAEANKDPESPEKVFNDYLDWIKGIAKGRPIVHAATPSAWDGYWVYYYLMRFAGESPSKHRCLDIRTLCMIATDYEYHDAHPHKAAQFFGIRQGKGEQHNALFDAREQGKVMMKCLKEIEQMKISAASWNTEFGND